MKIPTHLMGSMMKHAVAAGRDPFSGDPAGGTSIQPMGAMPGSMEAKRQEQAESQNAEAEAKVKEQEALAKQNEKQVQQVQKQYDQATKQNQKTQQELAKAQAQINAFEARDAASSPGLSASYNATQKRMLDSVKRMSNNMRQYNGALTISKAAYTADKIVFWEKLAELDKPSQVALLTKVATILPPSTGTVKPKRTSGAGVLIEPRVHSMATRQPPTPGPGGSRTAGLGNPNKPVSQSATGLPTSVSNMAQAGLAGAKMLPAAGNALAQQGVNRAAQSVGNEATSMLAGTHPQSQVPTWDKSITTAQQMRDRYGDANTLHPNLQRQYEFLQNQAKPSGGILRDMASEYGQFIQDPHTYNKERGGFYSDDFFKNMAARNYEDGTLGGLLKKPAAGADWVKNLITRTGNNLTGGGLGLHHSGMNSLAGLANAGGAGMESFGDNLEEARSNLTGVLGRDGMNSKLEDLRKATQVGWGDDWNEAVAPGMQMVDDNKQLLGDSAKRYGVGALQTVGTVGGAGMPQLGMKALPMILGGAGGELMDNTGGGTPADPATLGAGVVAPGAGAATPSTPASEPATAPATPPAPVAPAPTAPATPPDLTSPTSFPGSQGNPSYAQNINDYSGWANQNFFPQAASGYHQGGQGNLLGMLGQFLMQSAGSPRYNNFMQGQTAFRNAPQYTQMQNAMNAFGRHATAPMSWHGFNPAALSSYSNNG